VCVFGNVTAELSYDFTRLRLSCRALLIIVLVTPNLSSALCLGLTIVQFSSPFRQGLKNLRNFEARACIGLQKNLDFINKNVRLD